jgi:branched-subunit amino acid aminotransferase/4-amino-4-deoxychorismate lyase
MVTYLLKKSYLHKDLKGVIFKDLWGNNGIFTTMWIFGKPAKILFFKDHIRNLIKSLKLYNLDKPNLERNILKLIKLNIDKNINYNHLLRIAVNDKIISISFRKRIKTELNFNLRLINYKRFDPEFKNLKYQVILKYLSKLDPSTSDIGLCNNKKILESGTSNILFIKKDNIFSPINNIYKGVTYKFFQKKLQRIIKKDIFVKSLNDYDEIILIGSGKGVTSVKNINNIEWTRKSFKFYRKLKKLYMTKINNCSIY